MSVDQANATASGFACPVVAGPEIGGQLPDTAPLGLHHYDFGDSTTTTQAPGFRHRVSGAGFQALAVMASVACHPVLSRSICR